MLNSKKFILRDHFIFNFIFRAIRFFLSRCTDNNKIVILSFKYLGDTVFTVPTLKYIQHLLPNKNIIVFCYETSKTIYQTVLQDFQYVTFLKNEISLDSVLGNRKLFSRIRHERAEMIVDLTSGVLGAILVMLSSSKIKIGFNLPIFKVIYDYFTTIRKEPHLIDLYFAPVKQYFNDSNDKAFYSFKTNYRIDEPLLICPFAGWKGKEWGIRKYFELAKKLKYSYKIKFVLEPDTLSTDILEEFNNEGLIITYTHSVKELIDEISKCSLIIANDSGPVYMGNLLGKATFTIYGPTNPEFSLPFGNSHEYIRKVLPCTPIENQYCFNNAGRVCPANICMQLLSVDEVYERLLNFIKKIKDDCDRD